MCWKCLASLNRPLLSRIAPGLVHVIRLIRCASVNRSCGMTCKRVLTALWLSRSTMPWMIFGLMWNVGIISPALIACILSDHLFYIAYETLCAVYGITPITIVPAASRPLPLPEILLPPASCKLVTPFSCNLVILKSRTLACFLSYSTDFLYCTITTLCSHYRHHTSKKDLLLFALNQNKNLGKQKL